MGDRTCLQLQDMIHCRNCGVYTAAGRSLLDQDSPEGYLRSWTDTLSQNGTAQLSAINDASFLSISIFRLGREWFALPAHLFREVTHIETIHTLPHRTNAILRGLVNIRGELYLCISLANFLELEPSPLSEQTQIAYKRLVMVEHDGNAWVFPVDAMDGIHRIPVGTLQNLPTTASKAKDTYTKAIIYWQDERVSYLDDGLLFYTLNRRAL
jgi:chemotaxis-related protein WspD